MISFLAKGDEKSVRMAILSSEYFGLKEIHITFFLSVDKSGLWPCLTARWLGILISEGRGGRNMGELTSSPLQSVFLIMKYLVYSSVYMKSALNHLLRRISRSPSGNLIPCTVQDLQVIWIISIMFRRGVSWSGDLWTKETSLSYLHPSNIHSWRRNRNVW